MKRAVLILAITLLLALVISPTVSAAPPEWTILGYHTVRSGETLFCIARAYGVDPWAIATENGIINPNLIHPGAVLAIPAVYVALPAGPVCVRQFSVQPSYCTCATYYTIISGDTLTRISLTFGVNMWRIAECNGIFNLNYIRAGDTLCIPDP
ncbi:MAG: LysM peptidoglycan-binding domain-containing protein [Anaerolineae bacterium]|jgi:LysM repeat protein